MVFKAQIEKLLEELREKSDSESFDDDKEKLLNVQKAGRGKALEADRLKTQVKNMQEEAKLKE